jgi:hypothetical protein
MMRLVHRRRLGRIDHFVLLDDAERPSPARLVRAARRYARELALRCTGDADNFTLIHNGPGLSRRAAPHVHIVCARSRLQKALVYLWIGLRNLLPVR